MLNTSITLLINQSAILSMTISCTVFELFDVRDINDENTEIEI